MLPSLSLFFLLTGGPPDPLPMLYAEQVSQSGYGDMRTAIGCHCVDQ
jgi:hypothetical protein